MYTAHHMPLTSAFGTLHAVASKGLTVTVEICDACCAYVHRLAGRAKPVTGWDLSVLQKEALTTLVDLVTAHQGNTACLIGLTDLCNSVFTQSLPLCGDFGLQVCFRDCPPFESRVDILTCRRKLEQRYFCLGQVDNGALCRWTSLSCSTDVLSMVLSHQAISRHSAPRCDSISCTETVCITLMGNCGKLEVNIWPFMQPGMCRFWSSLAGTGRLQALAVYSIHGCKASLASHSMPPH